ncbi:hypothetical protein BJV74DRAFT_793128 [Russula compacta]|nr:hypothetical protein BJV74DRAFT_793128 [Russula compacta]
MCTSLPLLCLCLLTSTCHLPAPACVHPPPPHPPCLSRIEKGVGFSIQMTQERTQWWEYNSCLPVHIRLHLAHLTSDPLPSASLTFRIEKYASKQPKNKLGSRNIVRYACSPPPAHMHPPLLAYTRLCLPMHIYLHLAHLASDLSPSASLAFRIEKCAPK